MTARPLPGAAALLLLCMAGACQVAAPKGALPLLDPAEAQARAEREAALAGEAPQAAGQPLSVTAEGAAYAAGEPVGADLPETAGTGEPSEDVAGVEDTAPQVGGPLLVPATGPLIVAPAGPLIGD